MSLTARLARALGPQRCQQPGCDELATEYEPNLDLRTCRRHQPGLEQDSPDLPAIIDLRTSGVDLPQPVEQP